MSYLEIMNRLKKKEVAPVYLIYGTEPYFAQNIKTAIEGLIFRDDEERDISVYDLEETPIESAVGDAETYPFFSERKLVLANNPGFLKASGDKLPFEHDVAKLEQYLEAPVPYSVLVLTAPYEKLDERKKIVKLLKKHAVVAECHPVKEQQIGPWIDQIAKEHNIVIEKAAYEIFEVELGSNLRMLENEIQKMALYAGEDKVITKELAEKLIAKTTNSTAIGLVDKVIDKDLNGALRIFQELEKMKEEPIALLGLLAFQFRTILRVKLMKAKGYSQQQMQKQLGVHPYVVKIAASRERSFSVGQLERIIQKFTETDVRMKQGLMDKRLAFELLLYDIIKKA
ncbi:DNA polymerase III subunit delta [Aciduricibacillus chroicocephali]|uniref:DNA polymerase III subunit delta n=1 Tax=Aciduricibacillus chroicocephali TaxID=3054939 RepID=A0ABY9KV27_9BACI|nr:DNA polymerase III subunit delta [Bacillaceae bacterium 44XB]